jgi:hypothetical protein
LVEDEFWEVEPPDAPLVAGCGEVDELDPPLDAVAPLDAVGLAWVEADDVVT